MSLPTFNNESNQARNIFLSEKNMPTNYLPKKKKRKEKKEMPTSKLQVEEANLIFTRRNHDVCNYYLLDLLQP